MARQHVNLLTAARHRLAKEKLTDVVSLIRSAYGKATEPTTRAEETLAALQRLEWAIEREASPQLSQPEADD